MSLLTNRDGARIDDQFHKRTDLIERPPHLVLADIEKGPSIAREKRQSQPFLPSVPSFPRLPRLPFPSRDQNSTLKTNTGTFDIGNIGDIGKCNQMAIAAIGVTLFAVAIGGVGTFGAVSIGSYNEIVFAAGGVTLFAVAIGGKFKDCKVSFSSKG